MHNKILDSFLGKSYDYKNQTLNTDMTLENAIKEKEKFNVIICGATGVGKSTIINAFFGEDVVKTGQGKPVTQNLEKIEIPKKGLILWDTKGIEAEDYQNIMSSLDKQFFETFHEKNQTIDNLPHVGWICIDASCSRIQESDLELIKLVQKYNIPIVIIFTKVIGDKEKDFVNTAKNIILEGSNIKKENLKFASVLAQNYSVGPYTIEPFGLNELLIETINVMPQGKKAAVIALKKAQIFNAKEKLNAMIESADKIVNYSSAAAGAVGASPIPGSDAPLIAAVQTTMIYKINTEFELDANQAKATSVIGGILAITAVTQLGKTIVSNAIKFIPVAGSIIGGAISATTAAALTKAIGTAYISVLEYYYNSESAKVEFPENVDSILSVFKDYFKFKNK